MFGGGVIVKPGPNPNDDKYKKKKRVYVDTMDIWMWGCRFIVKGFKPNCRDTVLVVFGCYITCGLRIKDSANMDNIDTKCPFVSEIDVSDLDVHYAIFIIIIYV